MIYIFGDSHGHFSFINLKYPYVNRCQFAITMHRIGRDNNIVNFNSKYNTNENIFIICYGEIDSRCHIQKQINLGRNEDDIINNLVDKYFNTIKNNMKCKKIIIMAVPPQTKKEDYENIHGEITHKFPFVGSDEDRVRFTHKINILLEKNCKENNYIFFNPYNFYSRKDGTLKFELSDTCGHVKDTTHFLEEFYKIYDKI